jgi:hypothetical protein
MASDAGDCKRKLYFLYSNYEPTDPHDAHTLRKFAYGIKIEEQEIEWLYASKQGLDDHVRVNKPNPEAPSTVVAGEMDVILESKEGIAYIGEIKSGYGPSFKNDVLRGKPNARHLLQGMLYLSLSDYDHLVYIYIDRGTCDRTEHHLTLDNGIAIVNNANTNAHVSTIYKGFAYLHKCLKNNYVPKADFKQVYTSDDIYTLRSKGKLSTARYNKWQSGEESIGDWECKGCVFRSLCSDTP